MGLSLAFDADKTVGQVRWFLEGGEGGEPGSSLATLLNSGARAEELRIGPFVLTRSSQGELATLTLEGPRAE